MLILNAGVAFKLHRRVTISKSYREQVAGMESAATSIVEFQGSVLSNLFNFCQRNITDRRQVENREKMGERRFWNAAQYVRNADFRFHFLSQRHVGHPVARG